MTCDKYKNMRPLERLILEIFYHGKHCDRTVFFNAVCTVGVGVDDNAFALFFAVKHTPEGFCLCIFVNYALKGERCKCTLFGLLNDLFAVL